MPFFLLDITANSGRSDYCFTDDEPSGIGVKGYRLASGQAMGHDYPADPFEVTLQLGKDHPGLKLPSFIGNTGSYLLVHQSVAEFFKGFNAGTMEMFPFTLLDHKKRVYNREYVFFNPLGTVKCMNLSKSRILYDEEDGQILRVKTIVLDRSKLTGLPDLFRLHEKPRGYVFSGAMVDGIKAKGFTNFYFQELAVA
ncbi:MAG: hypothetical protein M0036_01370 [Desulfobacteraceae bacterium]|nr:hypothetical protein [Desulfobacteraceae bacterium]